jgi:hypothetical protein
MAFKEWNVVVAALGAGVQDVILRKGGVAEPGGSFEPGPERFLLMPTFAHQRPEHIREPFRTRFAEELAGRREPAEVTFPLIASVVRGSFLKEWEEVARLADRHIWTEAVVRERFLRWQPHGVHVLEVSVSRPFPPLVRPRAAGWAGCRSWVSVD